VLRHLTDGAPAAGQLHGVDADTENTAIEGAGSLYGVLELNEGGIGIGIGISQNG
jgi:hypothetical protein